MEHYHPIERRPKLIFRRVEGAGRLCATDVEGLRWIEYKLQWLPPGEFRFCVLCGARLEQGWIWLCIDKPAQVCAEHIALL